MCIIILSNLHVYFTTFDMILKYILTYMKNQPSHNSYKSCKTIYTIQGEGHVSLVVKISLYTPFCGGCGKCSFEKN